LKIGCEEKVRLNEDFEFIIQEYCTDLLQEGVVYLPNSFWRNYTFSLALKDINKQQDFLNALSYINVKIMALEIK
jgi:formylmethanofuran dehydrogenase subunit D